MTLRETQETVAAFVRLHDLEAPVQFRCLDLVSELGEAVQELLRATSYGRTPLQRTQEWDDELGDVFFSLVCLANQTAVDLHSALDRTLRKYESRIREHGIPSSLPASK